MIRFACPACGAKVAAPEPLAGRLAPCKRCGEKIRVPAAPPATAIAARRKEPCTEAAIAPAAREIPAPEVLPLFKTPPPTRLLVVIGLLAATLVLGVIGAGAGCYYFMYLPYAHKAAPLVPVAAPPASPTIPVASPIQNPAAPTPQEAAADGARKEAELKAERERLDKEEKEEKEELKAERERLDKEEKEEKEYRQDIQRFVSQADPGVRIMADHIAQELADPQCSNLPPGIVGLEEFEMLQNGWGWLFDGPVARSGVLRFARSSAGDFDKFDKSASEIGWSANDPNIADAAVEWYFMINNDLKKISPTVRAYKGYGYDKMPPPLRQFMLDHPSLFRPILHAEKAYGPPQARPKGDKYLMGHDELTMLVHMSSRFADPKCKRLSSGATTDADKDWLARFPRISQTLKTPAGLSEYLLLRKIWKDRCDTDIGRAGILRFASTAGFDKVSAEIGFAPADPDLTDAAVEWFFLPTLTDDGRWSNPQVDVQAAVDSYKRLGYDKMPRAGRQFMLDHPDLFRPILKANAGR